jgi:hypothetical protein
LQPLARDDVDRDDVDGDGVAKDDIDGDDIASENTACSTFADLNQTNPELQSYITQACELGLMGYYSDGKQIKKLFDPNETITLAEVATTISRLLRGEKYRGSEEWWYHNHLLALQKAKFLSFALDPQQKETRQSVFNLLFAVSAHE